MGAKSYIKRGFKYVLSESKQPIVKVEAVQKSSNDILKDKVFVVTGGGSGIGFEISKRLIEENATVIITGRNEDKLKKAQSDLNNNSKLVYRVLDIKNVNEFDEFFKSLFEEYGHIDGIVNNAGISLHEWDFLKVTPEGFDDQFLTNLKGGYFFTQSYIKHYLATEQNEGKILFVSSERGTYCDDLPYGLTKASMNSLVEALSYTYYKSGLNVNAISPGVTATNMTNINKEADLYSNQNSGRFFIPEEVAEVALFLLSDYSKCISGEIVHVNAGNHIRRGY